MVQRFSAIVFDLDNTIYDWYRAFIPAMYGMIDAACEILSCDKELLLSQLRNVHIRNHDVEHPFSIVETPLVQAIIESHSSDYAFKLLDPAFHIFNKLRKENLRLFEGAAETLAMLRTRDIAVFAYTDSKYYAALGRISRLNIADLFDRIYCREKSHTLKLETYKHSDLSALGNKIKELPSHQQKPNPVVLKELIQTENYEISACAYIGDSIAKDILMAKNAGCYSIWAKYGAYVDTAMYEKLVRISHWTEEDIELERRYREQAKNIKPDFVCERSITEILPLFR
jgi:FMN phosphatase YigB (HAD superfamily)